MANLKISGRLSKDVQVGEKCDRITIAEKQNYVDKKTGKAAVKFLDAVMFPGKDKDGNTVLKPYQKFIRMAKKGDYLVDLELEIMPTVSKVGETNVHQLTLVVTGVRDLVRKGENSGSDKEETPAAVTPEVATEAVPEDDPFIDSDQLPFI